MGVYLTGTSVIVTETFTVGSPFVPTDPTTVTFRVRNPDNTVDVYVFGIDTEVTNPHVGVYVLTLDSPSLPGEYFYRVEGTGTCEAASEGEFTVTRSNVLDTPVPPPPAIGPCTSWVDAADIAACCGSPSSDAGLFEPVALQASLILYEASGRLYAGLCEKTVRPCQQRNGCNWGGSLSYGGYAWLWTTWAGGWQWANEYGPHCGCGYLSRIKLSGYPVRAISEVKIDGSPISADEYRLDNWRYLTRMKDPAHPGVDLFWPACQDLALDDDQPGTWSVTYQHGIDPPYDGVQAAAQLACELYKACNGADDCRLPANAVRVVRQGITVERITPLAALLRAGGTGLVSVDAFMSRNPGITRRPAVWSPSTPQYARPLGG